MLCFVHLPHLCQQFTLKVCSALLACEHWNCFGIDDHIAMLIQFTNWSPAN